MSAVEIIEELRKLPVSEQERVLAFLRETHSASREPGAGARYANDADFEESAQKVMQEHAGLLRRLAQ